MWTVEEKQLWEERGQKNPHLPFCSSVNEEVMGTDLQEAKLMKQEADILLTYYQDWVWQEYWTFQSKLTLWFMFL